MVYWWKLDECCRTQSNIIFQAQLLQTITVKAGNSFNHKTQKITIKYECRAENVVFFYFTTRESYVNATPDLFYYIVTRETN